MYQAFLIPKSPCSFIYIRLKSWALAGKLWSQDVLFLWASSDLPKSDSLLSPSMPMPVAHLRGLTIPMLPGSRMDSASFPFKV